MPLSFVLSAMELLLPDARIGRDFSEKVHDLFGVPVAYGDSGPSSTFLLLGSFSRFRFRLSTDYVSKCLSVLLGGSPSSFAFLQLEDQVFQFKVLCKRVGFLVLHLKSFAFESFKLGFHLCNDSGFQEALVFPSQILVVFIPGPKSRIGRRRVISLMQKWFVTIDRPSLELMPPLWVLVRAEGNPTPSGSCSSHVLGSSAGHNRGTCFHLASPLQRVSVFHRISFPR